MCLDFPRIQGIQTPHATFQRAAQAAENMRGLVSLGWDSMPTSSYELPLPSDTYEKEMLGWCAAAIQEGERTIKSEPMYKEIEQAISYIMGEQADKGRPKSLSNVYDNRIKHILMQQVSALTDIRPLFGFKTMNDRFQAQADILNKLASGWWVNTQADLALGEIIKYAAGPGTGYCEVHWDASAAGGQGDIKLIPRDPRDVLPIRPTLSGGIQDWEGVVIRTAVTVNELKSRFPEKSHRIRATKDGSIPNRTWGNTSSSKQVMSPAALHLGATPKNAISAVPTANLYYIYTKDRRKHSGNAPIQMGDKNTSWGYVVQPYGERKNDGTEYSEEDFKLYPRGRLIICTDDVVLYDGPNPFWHGMFPIARLRMDPWPWGLLGVGITRDLVPLQDAANEVVNGILDSVRKALRPGIKGDARAMPESVWNRLDTRVPGTKIRSNPILGNIEYESPPNLPSYVFDFFGKMLEEMDYHGGVANLQALAQLKQAPGADSVEQMMEALQPTLRMKGRLIEVFLRDIGEMIKSNFFQFYTMQRRMALLGEQGIDMEDFNFDPGSLVPAYSMEADGAEMYMPEYDMKIPRSKRALRHQKQFTFQITPNSLLEISQISRKMMYLRLFREGLVDPWTLWEVLEIPNGGSPPSGTKEIPSRIAEAAKMGIGMPPGKTPGPQPTGQVPPHIEQKPDAGGIPRPVISESR